MSRKSNSASLAGNSPSAGLNGQTSGASAADTPVRRRYLGMFVVGLVLLGCLLPVAWFSSRAAVRSTLNDPAGWIPSDLPERVAWDAFQEQFDSGAYIFVSWPSADLHSPELAIAQAALRNLDARIPQAYFKSITSSHDVYERLIASPLSLPDRVARGRLVGSLLGPDGQQAVLVIELDPGAAPYRAQLVADLRATVAAAVDVAADQVRLVGTPVEGAVIDTTAMQSVDVFALPSALLAVFLCFLCLRSWWLTAAISLVAIISQGLVLGAVLLTGQPMNAILIVLPPLVFVLTVSAGIHLANYFLEAVAEHPGQSLEMSAQQAVKAGVPPCLLAALTTTVGLGSLLLVPIVPVRHFGLIAAVGVVASLGLLLLVLPGTMLLTRPTRIARPSRRRDIVFRKLARFPLRQPGKVLAVAALLAIFLGWGLTRLQTTVSIPNLLSPSHPMRQDYQWFQQHVGPTVNGELVVKFARPDESEPLQRLALIQRLHRQLASESHVGGVLSASSFLPPIPQRRGLAAAATRGILRHQIEDPDSDIGQLGYLAHADGAELWRISYRLPLAEGFQYAEELLRIGSSITSSIKPDDPPAEVSTTGEVILIETAQSNLLVGLLNSFLGAFIVVGVVMAVVLRSVVGGMLAMLPNAFPTLVIFGCLGFSKTPLDIGSVMTASVALGIAVDDTVHILSRFGSRRMRGFSNLESARGALRQCAAAMTQTTIVCGFSLLVYMFSDFLPTRRFALLMLSLLMAALVGDLLLLPALMATRLGRWLARPVLASAEAEVDADEPAHEKTPESRGQPTL
ncbi:efflux RND transporter permease subunit [Planctomycetaceae bacterium SH139]